MWRQRILLDWQRRLDHVYAAPLALIITRILFVISDCFLYCRHAAHRRLQQPERFCPAGDGLPSERAGVRSKRELHIMTCHVTCAQGACVCNWGYVGRACTLLCPGIIGSSAVCSGHGRCSAQRPRTHTQAVFGVHSRSGTAACRPTPLPCANVTSDGVVKSATRCGCESPAPSVLCFYAQTGMW